MRSIIAEFEVSSCFHPDIKSQCPFGNSRCSLPFDTFHSFRRPMASFAHAFYFWFSLIFLLGRTLAVCLYAAQIYDESKIPIRVLRAVPNTSWCLDVQRFSEEVINHTAALSGMRFFYLTRRLILSVTFQKVETVSAKK